MSRYLCFLILIVLTLVLISGCNDVNPITNTEIDWEPTQHNIVNTLKDVSMLVREGTVSPVGLTIVLKNDSNVEYTYGRAYSIEKNIEGKWYQVPTIRELEVPADELILLPSDSNEMDITWDYYYGKLDDGKYRLIIKIDPYILAAELIKSI